MGYFNPFWAIWRDQIIVTWIFQITFFRTLCDIQTEQKNMLLNASHRILALLFLIYLNKKSRFWMILTHFWAIWKKQIIVTLTFQITFFGTLCDIQMEWKNMLFNAFVFWYILKKIKILDDFNPFLNNLKWPNNWIFQISHVR